MRNGREQNGGREKKREEEEGKWEKGPNLFRNHKQLVENEQEVKKMNGNLGP